MADSAQNGVARRFGRLRMSQTMAVALAIGLGVHLVALILLGVNLNPGGTAPLRPGYVSIVHGRSHSGNLVVSEQLEYLDPEPLFMPTAWNAGYQPLPADLRRQPDQAFQSFEPQMTFSYNRLDPVFVPPNVAFEDPVRALDLGGSPRFSTVGREEHPVASLEREAYIEVRRVGDGGLVHAGPLTGLPPTIKETPWSPISLLVAVDGAGMVGSPMVEAGSGSTEIDDLVQGFLESKYRLGKRLSRGFYRVTVGP